MRLRALTFWLAVTVLVPVPAEADSVAVIAPVSGRDAWLGRSLVQSLTPVLGEARSVIDDECTQEGGAAAAEAAMAIGAQIVIGLPCIDALDGAAPLLSKAGIPVLVPGIRAADITRAPRGTEKWTVFRVGPTLDDEARVLGSYLASTWRDVPVAIIDDGTLYGRLIAEGVRAVLEENALKPVLVDTFRPLLDNQVGLVRRIARSGATHVVIGGEARDAAVISQSAELAGIRLTLAGGSYLIAPPSDGRLPDGTVAVDVPASTDLGSIAGAIALAALDGNDPADRLRSETFDTPDGPVRFGSSGEPDRTFLSIHVFEGGKPVPIEGAD